MDPECKNFGSLLIIAYMQVLITGYIQRYMLYSESTLSLSLSQSNCGMQGLILKTGYHISPCLYLGIFVSE